MKIRSLNLASVDVTSTHTSNSTVHEHRAPTDESVRLLREMEAAARESVLASFKTEGDNTITGTWVVWHDHSTWTDYVRCNYRINGVERSYQTEVPDKLAANRDWPGIVRHTMEGLIGSIAREVFGVSLCQALQSEGAPPRNPTIPTVEGR